MNVTVVYYFLDSIIGDLVYFTLLLREINDYCLVRNSALNLKILILQKLSQININRWIIYKKNEIKNVHFAGFLSMYLAKNLNTAPLSFVLASHSFCKTIMWKLYGVTFPDSYRTEILWNFKNKCQ